MITILVETTAGKFRMITLTAEISKHRFKCKTFIMAAEKNMKDKSWI